MDKINKILYLVIVFFIGGLGIHKFLNGRVVPGVVQIVITVVTLGFGAILALIEFIFDIIKCPSDENGEITIPSGFFDFL